MKNFDWTATPLFAGISSKELETLLQCLQGGKKEYKRGETVFCRGEPVFSMGLVLRGSVSIIQEDYWGNRQIMARIEEGELFGESYACLEGEPLMVDAIADRDAEILFLNMKKVLEPCQSACSFHNRLIRNLLSILAAKNLTLTQKIDHMGKRTIREKVLAYLSFQSEKRGERTFAIPFNRQQLADYLAVDRSALSAELSRMQQEGVIAFHKNTFSLLPENQRRPM